MLAVTLFNYYSFVVLKDKNEINIFEQKMSMENRNNHRQNQNFMSILSKVLWAQNQAPEHVLRISYHYQDIIIILPCS